MKEIHQLMIIEDDPGHAELIKRNIKRLSKNIELTHIADGEKALEYLFGINEYEDRRNYPLPHLILLDLRLPKVDGIEVLSKIKASKKLKQIPVIVLTTSQKESDIIAAYNNHVNSYLVKPLDNIKFKEMLKELELYWFDYNQIVSFS